MTQGFTPLMQFLLQLLLMGFAMAGLHLWPSVHVALSNASVFVTYNADSNMTDSELSMDLVDLDKNVTVLTRPLPFNQSAGILEFDCTYFLYAGNFSFRLDQMGHQGALKSTSSWWSPVLRIQWPTFHFGVERANNNHNSGAFQVSVSTNLDFHVCLNSNSSLYLEVSYMEHNQIGKNTINKVQKRTTHNIQVVKSQHVDLQCASLLTEAGFIQVALKSHYTQQDIKSSGPLYLSRIFSYKLLVENLYKSGCEGTVSVRLLSPPCTVTTGKVLLYKEASAAPKQENLSQLAFHFLTGGENETEFNCSQFDVGQKKYCFHYARIYSQSSSLAHTCIIVQRNAVDMWVPWQTWSGCSVTCGEGVRERVRECLLPPGGGMQCTGMVREQSLCSLEDCTDVLPPVSVSPPPAVDSFLGGNLVVLAGISLCLAVILVTILITVWRKVCHAPKCSSARPDSMHSPGGRKNSDEASICGRSVQRPSFSESMVATAFPKGQTCPVSIRAASDKGVLACQQSFLLPMPLPQDPDRLSPSGQKILPPIFGYRLAQQQLKEMKKKGLKEDTRVYLVSQSPVDDTMVEATASTSAALTPVPQDLESQEEVNISHLRKSPFTEPTRPHRNSATLPDRLSPKVDLMLATPKAMFSDRDRRQERTADWVAMVERNRLNFSKNPNFRRTSSFNESNLQHLPKPQPFRERSMTQVTPRQHPEGSCRTRNWEHPIPELEDWSQTKYRIPDSSSDHRQQPWVDMPSFSKSKPTMVHSGTSVPTKNRVTDSHGVGWASSFGMDRVERAEQNWNRRGPSPIQRNILARKLREANSSTNNHRQRSSTFSSSDQSRGRFRSLPLSADYSSSSYGLTEDEQRMMDISGYLGEEDGTGIMKDLRLT
ncbi:thrombospondin type-1 domain-containing protein 1 isoform X1 [Ictalurus furcatus]|uniref:thrombospondin type-1 domain-containing protein 1 isoform X1 n=1 Tax=Ictalurus furcatus TaxID=66913 RepID=UPI00235100A4|nr:thrombospondin type-1 domain-containing protein 1 isoform X1 [Ictalurus furcatus]XP_053502211.1 thrombospondin type-1 domain-containing protein 1 isoform X1 [Ictalurus furcatus]